MRIPFLTAALALGASFAQAADPKPYQIAAQPISAALKAFAAQSDMQILFTESDVGRAQAPELKGTLLPQEALATILKGTGLEFEFTANNVIVVRKAESTPRTPHVTSRAQESDRSGLRLATAGYTDAAESSTASVAPPERSRDAQRVTAGQSAPDKVEEIQVIGSRIRGVTDIAAPVQIIDREEIRRNGYTSLPDVLQQLPQNFAELGVYSWDGGGGYVSNASNNNFDRAVGIDLRGLGTASTLTLLNGTRRAGSANGYVVDLSIIPTAVIERIEIVSGGRSAVYGSDAVGGVVNILTRHNFNGAETDLLLGGASYGGERVEVSQLVGRSSEGGGFVAAYDYTRDWPLDIVDADLVAVPTPRGSTPLESQTLGNNIRHTLYLSGHRNVGERIDLFADAIVSRQRNRTFRAEQYPGAPERYTTRDGIQGWQYGVAAGAKVDMAARWLATLTATTSAVDNNLQAAANVQDNVFPYFIGLDDTRLTRSSSGSVVFEGPLFEVAGIEPRFALGGETREEKIETTDVCTFADSSGPSDCSSPLFQRRRTIHSVFGELYVPLADADARTGRIELTAAGRADFYSDVGDTFNPQVGLVWRPVADLAVRASYATAFRAPSLIELQAASYSFVQLAQDPNAGSVPVLYWEGRNPDLEPETAHTWTFALDLTPHFAPGVQMSLAYFNVKYRGRIDAPSQATERDLVLAQEDRYVGLVNRTPDAADVAKVLAGIEGTVDNSGGLPWTPDFSQPDLGLLAALPNLVIYDGRTTNAAVEKMHSLDLLLHSSHDSAIGAIGFDLNLTRTLKHDKQLTATSPAFSRLNAPGLPVDFRGRFGVDWARGPYGAHLAVNYIDGYDNPFSTPFEISSGTNLDLALRYTGAQGAMPALNGMNATVSVENVLDRRPPRFLNRYTGQLYDPTNTNSIGRYVSVRLTKAW